MGINNDEYRENLIARYLNGDCTREQQEELRLMIEASVEQEKDFFALKDIWDSLSNTADCTSEQLAFFYKNRLDKAQKTFKLRLIATVSSVAAFLLVALFVSVFYPHSDTDRQTGQMQVFSVPLGSRSKVVLADGSVVNLNSGSELRCSSSFSNKNRVVNLTGEAFFDIKTDKQHPFIVKTSDFDVKVTGTKFNVCTYDDNKFSATTLAEGKIELRLKNSTEDLAVEPGEKFQLNRESLTHTVDVADIESETAWKDDQFIFRNTPFPDLAKRLERWYDITLIYNDKRLDDYKFTGKFKNQETIWQVFEALKLISPIDYSKKSFRVFTITYKPMSMK